MLSLWGFGLKHSSIKEVTLKDHDLSDINISSEFSLSFVPQNNFSGFLQAEKELIKNDELSFFLQEFYHT